MPDQHSNNIIVELNRALSQSVIHYDPTRIDYTISDGELSQLEMFGNSIWKDVFFATLGLWIPTVLNAIITQNKLKTGEPINVEIVINYIAGVSGFIICIIALSVWRFNVKKHKDVIKQIKNKPKFTLPH